MDDLNILLKTVEEKLLSKNCMLITVESCTGGGLAAAVTSRAGSSRWFDRSWITYSNQAKSEMVNVPMSLIEDKGAVSKEVAMSMTAGALQNTLGDRLAVSITGIAGPDGGSARKPVGTVFMSWQTRSQVVVKKFNFAGDRGNKRALAIESALLGILEINP